MNETRGILSMRKRKLTVMVLMLPLFASCAGVSENGGIILKMPSSKSIARDRNIRSECIDGKQTTKIYIANPGFEQDVVGQPKYWKYGIPKGWGAESDPTYLLDPQKGAGIFDIRQHKVITFNTDNSGDNVVFLHRGTVKIKQTLDYAVKPNATYTLSVLLGRRIDIPFGSYRLALYGGDELLAKTNKPVPIEGEFLNVQLVAKTTKDSFAVGRPLKIELENTSTTSKDHYKKTQLVADNFELYEQVECSASSDISA